MRQGGHCVPVCLKVGGELRFAVEVEGLRRQLGVIEPLQMLLPAVLNLEAIAVEVAIITCVDSHTLACTCASNESAYNPGGHFLNHTMQRMRRWCNAIHWTCGSFSASFTSAWSGTRTDLVETAQGTSRAVVLRAAHHSNLTPLVAMHGQTLSRECRSPPTWPAHVTLITAGRFKTGARYMVRSVPALAVCGSV